jgi:hypothetical protein
MIEPCSTGSADAGEALIGSAPSAPGWVCLEQNGPWGARAWTSSHLDPALGAAIERAAADHGVRPALVRRPGRHADLGGPSSRQVLVAHAAPGSSWLLAGTIDAPEELLALDWAAVASGDVETVTASVPGLEPAPPQLLVCTNGARDTCCARLGRPVAATAARQLPGRVWEVTHTSGHRFAPTTVLLPSGSLHGRVLDAAPLLLAEDAGQLVLTGYRGRSVWPRAGQVAEEHVRRTSRITGLGDLQVRGSGAAWEVSHRDGRRWQVSVTAYDEGERPESCGTAATSVTRYTAVISEAAMR